MESRKRIGLYGSGEVPRSRRLASRSVGPKSRGLRDIGALPPIRRIRPRMATKTLAAAAVAPLAAVLVIVTAVLLATASVPIHTIESQQTPPPPYNVVGYTYDNLGNPVGGVQLTITNLRTGLYDDTVISDPTEGAFIFNLNTISGGVQPLPGDMIRIVGVLGIWTGTSEAPVPDPMGGYLWLDVNLITAIPEFSEVVLPVVGMVAMFAMVAVVARSKKNE